MQLKLLLPFLIILLFNFNATGQLFEKWFAGPSSVSRINDVTPISNGNTSTQTQDVIITPIDNTVTQVDAITLTADASGYTYQWIDCDNGNQAINGETSQTFVATVNGNYAVEISNGTCAVVSDCILVDNVDLSDNESINTVIYPNPTINLITIKSSYTFNSIEVFNAVGKIVYRTELNHLDSYQLELPEAKGVYLIKISTDTNSSTYRIIKN